MSVFADDARPAIMKAAIPRTIKLYGQIIPNIKSGGCHLGEFRLRYQSSPVFTQKPEPIT